MRILSSKEDKTMRIRSISMFLCAFVLVSAQRLVAVDPVPRQGSQTVTAGMPTGPSPDAANKQYTITVYYTDPTGKNTSTNVMVPDIPVTAGLPNPTAAQVSTASAAKQAAIIKAINAANIAIKPVVVNGVTYEKVTAAADAKTVPGGMYPTGQKMPQVIFTPRGPVVVQVPVFAPADFSSYTVNGVTQRVINPGTAGAKLGGGLQAANNVTGETGNGKVSFTTGSPTSAGGRSEATFSGPGALAGLSTGLDPSGNPSLVGFGFIDETSSTPVDYLAAFYPQAGMTDLDVLSDLSSLFNEDFASAGYTSRYDADTDTLSIDQLLPDGDFTWSANSDTGLFLDDSLNTVPEPGSLLLLGTGLAGLAACLRRKRARGSVTSHE
jgi:hypothetical protein